MSLPRLTAFDLDDTLAPSKSPLDPAMARALAALLELMPVAVISGGRFEQFRDQVITPIARIHGARLDRLHVLATCGTQYFRLVEGAWERIYEETLDDDEKARAVAAIESSARALGLWPEVAWGEVIEDRRSQITFSALGQQAPLEEKMRWDANGAKKLELRDRVAPLIPDLEVRVGGSTSIDITRAGRDKAFGMRRLMEQAACSAADILFFGDQLQPGGNDNPVIGTGVACVAVTGWPQTLREIERMVSEAASPGD